MAYGFVALAVWRCLPLIIGSRDRFIIGRPVGHFLSQGLASTAVVALLVNVTRYIISQHTSAILDLSPNLTTVPPAVKQVLSRNLDFDLTVTKVVSYRKSDLVI